MSISVIIIYPDDDVSMSISVIIIYPDDDDRDGHRNVGIQRTPNAADSPRRLYQDLSVVLYRCETSFLVLGEDVLRRIF
jgi:hypothetical protein